MEITVTEHTFKVDDRFILTRDTKILAVRYTSDVNIILPGRRDYYITIATPERDFEMLFLSDNERVLASKLLESWLNREEIPQSKHTINKRT